MPRAILIGPPGSGKSVVGKALSKVLGTTFIDTDKVIEARAGRKISDIFVDDGEAVFRELEFETLVTCLKDEDAVLSLGGGAPISPRAQEVLAASGAPVIFLDVSLSVAAPRVGFNRDRPLLLGNPRAQWQALYEERKPIYSKLATMTIQADVMNPNEIATEIAGAL